MDALHEDDIRMYVILSYTEKEQHPYLYDIGQVPEQLMGQQNQGSGLQESAPSGQI